jgi:hypothetical protein
MQLPDAVKQVRSRYIAEFPVPQGAPGEEFEERARQWSIHFAEQVAFELPNQGWGMKRADPNRPISKDTIARQVDGRLLIWDLLTGTGTGSPRPVENPESEDITGQTFVPVQPTNHLRNVAPPPPPPPPAAASPGSASTPTSPASPELAAAVDHLAAIRATLDAVLKEQRDTRALLESLTTRLP